MRVVPGDTGGDSVLGDESGGRVLGEGGGTSGKTKGRREGPGSRVRGHKCLRNNDFSDPKSGTWRSKNK